MVGQQHSPLDVLYESFMKSKVIAFNNHFVNFFTDGKFYLHQDRMQKPDELVKKVITPFSFTTIRLVPTDAQPRAGIRKSKA